MTLSWHCGFVPSAVGEAQGHCKNKGRAGLLEAGTANGGHLHDRDCFARSACIYDDEHVEGNGVRNMMLNMAKNG